MTTLLLVIALILVSGFLGSMILANRRLEKKNDRIENLERMSDSELLDAFKDVISDHERGPRP